jgi:uncharacterized membrane protein YhiD involved in acid resistance
MTIAGEDGVWVTIGIAVIGNLVTAVVTAWGVIRWLLLQIDDVRDKSEQKIEAVRKDNEAANERLERKVLAQLDAHRGEYRQDQINAQRWREGVLATMLTRAEADRMLDRQNEQLLDRLDSRFRPLVEEARKRRSTD